MTLARPLRPGVHVRRGYEVIAHLRRGDDADIYDVWSSERDCRAIVKTIVPGTRSRTARARLLTEGQRLMELTHPNLVRAYEVHTRPVTLVLETLPGATLGYLIETEGRSPLVELGVLGVQLCSVLGYLHRHDLLHLDVKPSNVVCGEAAKLLDLGIAAPAGPSLGYGTPAYMAPEQRRGGIVGPAADVWGLGVTLFEAAAGEHPFGLGGHNPAVPVRSIRRERRLPRAVSETIDACCAPDPAHRPQLTEVAAVFREVAQ